MKEVISISETWRFILDVYLIIVVNLIFSIDWKS